MASNGQLAVTRDSVELPDCDYESLLELFRYIYSDEVNLSGSNAMGVLYLAKKYMVPSLAEKCTEYLQENLDPSNVFSILPSAQKYEEKYLVERCWRVIDQQTKEVVKPGNGFTTIERSLLEAIVTRDTLNIKEVDLFCAIDSWAKGECERQGLTADGTVKRRILGERVVKAIRFPTMEQVDFATAALDSKILTTEEIVRVVQHINSVLNCPVGFSDIKRSGFLGDIQRCCRFVRCPSATAGNMILQKTASTCLRTEMLRYMVSASLAGKTTVTGLFWRSKTPRINPFWRPKLVFVRCFAEQATSISRF